MEKQIKKTVKIALIFLAIGLLLGIIIVFAATPATTFYISSGIYPGALSYTIWEEGSNYFAKDSNGQIEFSGTNASQIIQNTLDAIPIDSGANAINPGPCYTVKIIGTTTLDYGITITKSNTILDLTDAKLTFSNSANQTMITVVGLHRVTILGGDLNGNKAGRTANTNVHLIYIQGCYFSNIYRVTFHHSTGHGIYVSGAHPYEGAKTKNVIEECKSYSNTLDGIYATALEEITIQKCFFKNDVRHGINLYNVNYSTIMSNTIEYIGENGIQMSNGDPGTAYRCIGNSVLNNKVIHCGWTGASAGDGLFITRAQSCIIANNHANDSRLAGIVLEETEGFILSNNIAWFNYVDGIQIANCSDGTISTNTAYNNFQQDSGVWNGSGILVSATTHNCTFMGNICYDDQTSATQEFGICEDISAGAPSYCVYIGSICKDNSIMGIWTESGSNAHVNLCWNGTSWIS